MSPSQARTARMPGRDSGRSTHPAPLVLERYRLHRRLGAGAFGTVWMARDERLERDVAVKILPTERIMGGRFEREARAAARLAHPGIVTLYEAAVDDEGAYLVSELVRGSTLGDLLEEGRLSDRDVVALGVALCDALSHAHTLGIVHRDVKPSNVLVPDQPASPAGMAKLTDFGIARVVGGDALTLTGDVLGTLAYMAPEQAEGLAVGASADLYSLAVVLYEALTGINPVRVGPAAQRARRLGAYLPPLRRQRRDLSPLLGHAIDLALRPRPRERGTVTELRRALVAAHALVGEDRGVVVDSWPRSVTERRSRLGAEDELAAAHGEEELGRAGIEPAAGSRPGVEPTGSSRPEAEPGAPSRAWAARGLAALAAAGAAIWLSRYLLDPPPLAPAAGALLAGGLTLLLPRVGWLALAGAACGTAAVQGRPGGALVVLIAMLLPVILLFGRPTVWALAAGAPALGLVGLAGAWPALAARAGSIWRRAALGLTGWVWLLLAAQLADRELYLPLLPGVRRSSVWITSPPDTVHSVLMPLLSTGALAPAPVWALAAALLPWVVIGRSPVLDLLRVVMWAATLFAASAAAVTAVHGAGGVGVAPSAAVGVAAAAVVAFAPSALAAWRARSHLVGSEAGFP